MAFEHVTVVAGSMVYSDWETVVIEADVNAGYVNVLLTTTEITSIGADTQDAFDKWNFPPGVPIQIYAGDDLVVNAIVWQYSPSADASQHSITVYARTASYGFVIGSIDPRQTGGTYENTNTHQLLGEWMQASGVWTYRFFGAPADVPIWQLRQGATGYEEGLRVLKPHGQMLFGLMDGSIAVSDGQALGLQGPIVQGENIISMAAQLTDDMFQERIVTGQLSLGQSLREMQPNALSSMSLKNGRLKLITEPSAIDDERARQRVDWEARREHGATTQAVITVPGWHAPSGESYVPTNSNIDTGRGNMGPLWMLMADTYIYAPWLKINCVMRACKVTFKQSLAEGSTTTLTFTDPAAFNSMTPSVCKSGTMWLPKFDLGSVFKPPGIGHM